MSRRRSLHPDEHALWEQVARSARALPGRARSGAVTPPGPKAAPPKPATLKPAPAKPAPTPLPPDFAIGAASGRGIAGPHDLARPIAEALRDAPVAMDRRQFQRLSRGRLTPEARLDLHGMTLARAQGALTGFIADAWSRGLRLVLVITGKGRTGAEDGPIPRRTGALRHEVPLWLRRPPLAPMILDLRPAHQRHGGDGALYVYLRRRR